MLLARLHFIRLANAVASPTIDFKSTRPDYRNVYCGWAGDCVQR